MSFRASHMAECVDVVIVGAGISGIGTAAHLKKDCPNLSCLVLERRDTFGGTWDLFKYPGLRSDSSMFTFGYGFKPWPSPKPIAEAAAIKEYLHGAIEDQGLPGRIRYGHHVVRAEWSTASARWHLQCDNGARFECWFLFSCAGYYNQDQGWQPKFDGSERFEAAGGRIVHPQKWTDDVVYKGKRVVVVGSGATAVTLVPNLAKEAAHVTMLQRSPTYIIPWPNASPFAVDALKEGASAEEMHMYVREKLLSTESALTAKLQAGETQEHRNDAFIGFMRQALPQKHMSDEEFAKHFTPRYNVWEQRVCISPDGDFYQALREEHASIVTDQIEALDERGIRLKSGDHIDADLVVTATGLQLDTNAPMATMQVSIDGIPYVARDHFLYKGCMVSDVPNLAYCRGYFAASWTLKTELVAKYICRLLQHMLASGVAVVTPRVPSEGIGSEPQPTLSAGYVLRSIDTLPRHGGAPPWSPLECWEEDRQLLLHEPISDGVLEFAAVGCSLRSRL